jgi:hypothetical protein
MVSYSSRPYNKRQRLTWCSILELNHTFTLKISLRSTNDSLVLSQSLDEFVGGNRLVKKALDVELIEWL